MTDPTPEQIERWERRYETERVWERLIKGVEAFADAFRKIADDIRLNYAAETEKRRQQHADDIQQRQAAKAADDAAYAEWKQRRTADE